jgi:two-component system OmpR family sensor kinase
MKDRSTHAHNASVSRFFKKPRSLHRQLVLANSAIFLLCFLLFDLMIILLLTLYNHMLNTSARTPLLILIVVGTLAITLFALVMISLITHRTLRPLLALNIDSPAFSPKSSDTLLASPSTAIEIQDLARTFNHMNKHLETGVYLQRNFVDAVSHELRTPLTAIRGQVDVLLMNTHLTGIALQDVHQIRADIARVSRLLTNLLMATRAEMGILPELNARHTQCIEVHTLLTEIIRQFRQDNQQHVLDVEEMAHVEVQGDADLLKHLILTILDHTLYTNTTTPHPGHLSVALSTMHNPPAILSNNSHLDWAMIRICDAGPALAPDDIAHLFEPYSRSLQYGLASKRGVSSGLFVSRLIAGAHGGDISVENTSTHGSCFHICLPMV